MPLDKYACYISYVSPTAPYCSLFTDSLLLHTSKPHTKTSHICPSYTTCIYGGEHANIHAMHEVAPINDDVTRIAAHR